MTTQENGRLRNIVSYVHIFMKAKPFRTGEGGYFIGNCDMSIGMKNTIIQFIPPDKEFMETQGEEGRGAMLLITNGTYNNREFEKFVDEEFDLDGTPAYFHGYCNIDLDAKDMVFRFIPERHGSEENVLVVQQTKHKSTRPDGSPRKINNPLEVKIYMQQKDLA